MMEYILLLQYAIMKFASENIMDNNGFVNPFDGPDSGLPDAKKAL
jgi:hypothetical protein